MPKDKAAEPAEKKTVETLCEEHGTPAWLFAAAKMKAGWVVGSELTESEYKKALKAAAEEPIGAMPKKEDS